jgi:hypothetical protein
MDLLFKRYASPFLLLDSMLEVTGLIDFVEDFINSYNEEENEEILWEFYLHREFEKSYEEFKKSLVEASKSEKATKKEIETAVKDSKSILENFHPNG